MVIPQPERILLREQIKKYGHYLCGVVLDVGAGNFKRYQDLLKFDKYIALDNNSENQPDILASAEQIPLGDESVDSVICTQVLGDLENFEQALREFYRLLKPGGVVLLTESLMAELHDEPRDFWRFTDFALDFLFKKAGFEVMKIEQRGGFFSVIAQLRMRYLIDRFNLYSKWWARLFNPFFRIYCAWAIFLDKLDKSRANRKHSLGWCVVARKQKEVLDSFRPYK